MLGCWNDFRNVHSQRSKASLAVAHAAHTHTCTHACIPTHTHTHRVAIDSLRIFLECTESQLILERLGEQNVWPLFETEDTYPHGMLHTARALSEEHPTLNREVVDALSSSLNSIYDDHRVTVVAFYSEVGVSCDCHVTHLIATACMVLYCVF